MTHADSVEGKVVSGAVMVSSAVAATAAYAGGALLAAAGGEAVAGALAGGGATAGAAGGALVTAASADGDPTNEIQEAIPTAEEAHHAMSSVLQNELKNVRISYPIEYNPAESDWGSSMPFTNIRISPAAINAGREELMKTIVHEELHQRIWERTGLIENSDRTEAYIERVTDRFARMIGNR